MSDETEAFLPEPGRGTATRSGGVAGHGLDGAPPPGQEHAAVPLHHRSDGPPPPVGEERAPHHNQWTREKMVAFLRELAATQSVSAAARAVGMSRTAAYNLRNRLQGQPFALGWEVALEFGLHALAQAVMDRALNGEEVPHLRPSLAGAGASARSRFWPSARREEGAMPCHRD